MSDTPHSRRLRVGPLAATTVAAPVLDVDALLDDPSTGIIVCCGSGGVGKTTTSAALALRAAERGRTVVVLTIDPARRLAQSMGIEELDNTPRPVAGVDPRRGRPPRRDDARHEAHLRRGGREPGQPRRRPGRSWTTPSTSRCPAPSPGTQEYMAMEKLGQLHRDAQARRHLRPDRRGHPAVALGAGLPRRPRAALQLPGRPVHPAAAGAGARAGPADDRRARRSSPTR